MDAAGAVLTEWSIDATEALPAPLAEPGLTKCAISVLASSSSPGPCHFSHITSCPFEDVHRLPLLLKHSVRSELRRLSAQELLTL